MMGFRKILGMVVVAGLVASCGGGGGSPSVPVVALPGTGTTPTTPVKPANVVTLDVLGGSGSSTTTISAAEIAQARATVKDANGAAIKGAIVTFSEVTGSLLSFAPASKTALTDDQGLATVEVKAATTTSLGATTINASVTINGDSASGQKAIAITGAPAVNPPDPQVLANALNFLDVNPADRSIVLAGSGGNGRSESATLRFRVVDKNNTPVKGTAVTFTVTPANDVVLNIPTAVSDSDGIVVTTVSSKNVATAVVVQAKVNGKEIASQSGTLTVTTGIATAAGFDISATKYNLNSRITGDTSIVTVRIRDVNGNPVTDGVPVVFTADYGAIGSSSRGGCVTLNGGCSVPFVVQDPRPADGTLATVTASTRLGSGETISKQRKFVLSDPLLLDLYLAGAPVQGPIAISQCASTLPFTIGTPAGYPAPAETAVTAKAVTPGLTVTVAAGGTIADQLSSPPQRTRVDFSYSTTGVTDAPCVAGGAGLRSAEFEVTFTSGTIVSSRRVQIVYPTQ